MDNPTPEAKQVQLRIMSQAQVHQEPPNKLVVKMVMVGVSATDELYRIADVEMTVNVGIADVFPNTLGHLKQRLTDLKLLPKESSIEIVKPGGRIPPLAALKNGG